MKFYAIADKYEDGAFYNFEKEDFTLDILSGQCLLPTKKLADEYIEDQLGSDCVPVEIDILRITKDGTMEFTYDNVWDDEDEEA